MEYEHSQGMLFEFTLTQMVLRAPHVRMKPRIFQDGNMWCCLYGKTPMEGVCAFGKTPHQATEAFDLVWGNGEKGCDGTPLQDESLEDENLRLREALEWFIEPDHAIGSNAEMVYKFRDIASKALSPHQPLEDGMSTEMLAKVTENEEAK